MYKKFGIAIVFVLAISPFLVSAQTIAEVKAQIQSLREQLAQWEALLAQLEADPSTEVLNGTWSLGTWSAVAGATFQQSGVMTFVENTANTSHGIQQYINVPEASIWEISFEANPIGARGALIYLMDAANQSAGYVAVQCDFTSTGRIIAKWAGADTTSSASITRLADGWYKCTARAKIYSSATASQLRIVIYTEKNATSAYQGDGASGLQFRNIVLGGKFVGTPPAKATLSSDFVQSLFALREGYGANTTGGLDGDVYMVTTLNDSGPGSLRFAAEDTTGKPTWITFDPAIRGGTITLATPLRIGANKTIDGRGSGITIANRGLEIGANYGSSNVIVSHIAVRNVTDKEQDNISIYGAGVKNVWIHRVSLSGQGSDGLLDITNGATDITVDSSRFTDHDAVMIINSYPSGADIAHALDFYDRDKEARVTLHHNVFLGTTQRHPRSVFGKIHMYNNVLKDWGSYGMGSSFRAQTLAEGNIFESSGPYGTSAMLAQVGADPEPGFINARDNLFVGNAVGSSSGAESVFSPPYQYRCELASSALESRLIQSAGVEGSDSANVVPFVSACPQIPLPAPTCTITSNKTSYAYGETISLTWSSINASSAAFVPATSGQVSMPSGALPVSGTQSVIANAAGSSSVTLRVTSSSGVSGTCSATFSVASSPAVTWQSLTGSLVGWSHDQSTGSSQNGIYTLVENTGTQAHRIQQYVTISGTNSTMRFSFEVSPVGARGLRVYVIDTDRADNYIASNFGLTGNGWSSKWKGQTTTGNETAITKLSDGWYKITMSGLLSPTTTTSKLRLVLGAEVNGSEGYQGDGASGFKIRNVALERQVIGTASGNADATQLANSLTALQGALQALVALFAL